MLLVYYITRTFTKHLRFSTKFIYHTKENSNKKITTFIITDGSYLS